MSEHSNFEGSSESLKMGLTVELKQNEHIMGQLQQYDEDIVWAGNVEKWSNGRSIKQARILVLGTKAVYNFKWKESTSSFRLSRTRSDMSAEDINPSECDVVLGWRRPYETLRWITCSRTSKEFIMHLPSEKYDYRYLLALRGSCRDNIELIAVTSGRNQWATSIIWRLRIWARYISATRSGPQTAKPVDRAQSIPQHLRLLSRRAAGAGPRKDSSNAGCCRRV